MAEIEIYLDKGANLTYTYVMSNTVTNTAINVANYTFTGNVSNSFFAANVVTPLTITKSDNANGTIIIGLAGSVSANLYPKNYVFSVAAVNNATNIKTFPLKGTIVVGAT